jgi:hypothetical protein
MLEPLGATEAITDGYCSTPELNLVERYFAEHPQTDPPRDLPLRQ